MTRRSMPASLLSNASFGQAKRLVDLHSPDGNQNVNLSSSVRPNSLTNCEPVIVNEVVFDVMQVLNERKTPSQGELGHSRVLKCIRRKEITVRDPRQNSEFEVVKQLFNTSKNINGSCMQTKNNTKELEILKRCQSYNIIKLID
ncbi:MAG: hypothetical protein MHPSP_001732, partial [Paramarteilia canceri]